MQPRSQNSLAKIYQNLIIRMSKLLTQYETLYSYYQYSFFMMRNKLFPNLILYFKKFRFDSDQSVVY